MAAKARAGQVLTVTKGRDGAYSFETDGIAYEIPDGTEIILEKVPLFKGHQNKKHNVLFVRRQRPGTKEEQIGWENDRGVILKFFDKDTITIRQLP